MNGDTVYYKALRPDGTDFATGKTRPRRGRWMPRIDGELIMCERGYHVSDAVASTLIGGSWPCKLARVEIPEGEWQREGHKLVVPTYRVVEWLPAWQAFGPNGKAVAAMLNRARRLTADEVQRLDAAAKNVWSAACGAAKGAAWEAACGASVVTAWKAAREVAMEAAGETAREAAGKAATFAAREAVADAARALVIRDLITPEQFDTLYGPWASVVEGAP